MAPSSQNSSSTHASHNNRFIRRGHNSEIRRTPYGTERSRNHRRDRRGYRSQNPFQFTGTTHIHTAIIIMDAESFSLHPRDWHYPQPSGGLYRGGFTSGAQMNAVRPGSVTSGYNLGGPGANLTPGGQTPAVGLGPAGSSGVGYSQLSPIVTLGFEGQTSQAPFLQEYDTQAAPPPPTLDQQLFPPSWVTAANNDFAEDFLPPAERFVAEDFLR